MSYDDDLFVLAVTDQADLSALLVVLEEISAAIGYCPPVPRGVNRPLFHRFEEIRVEELENQLRSLEDVSPAVAARLQERIAQARKRLGQSSQGSDDVA